ncbi:hypothetical protein M569_16032, partial [Genlisea aurea]
ITTSQMSLIASGSAQNANDNAYSAFNRRLKFLQLGNLESPSARFQQLADERDQFSRSVPSSSSTSPRIRERFHRLFSRKIDWSSMWRISKEWIRNPFNMALFIWMIGVAVSGAFLFMIMTGMLNGSLRKKSQRDVWFEVNNQILNALFTLMCLYQHPQRIYHLTLLLRWKPDDVLKLRSIYCKNGTYKPNEWTHMMVVVIALNVNCIAQYALCGLNLGYKRSKRPAIGVGITLAVALGAAAFAGVYTILSPLGRDYETETTDEEAQDSSLYSARRSLEKKFSFVSGGDGDDKSLVPSPRWSGGILDFWDDISLAYLSLFCSFCVFGWNMERLGFGNMYVHIATFLLLCVAPFWIFNLAAVNIQNEVMREALGITGICLCAFGLLYGGFWRIQMRKRYNLPPYSFCCGKAAASECCLWLFCCWCSLAQEVRTGNAYDIVDDRFCRKMTS